MIEIYIIGPIFLFVLSTAFLLVWVNSRPNNAALMWGIAHAAYGLTILSGFYFQQHGGYLVGMVSLITSCIYFVTFWFATEAFEGREIGSSLLVTFLVGLAIVSISSNQFSARATFSLLSFIVLTRSGVHFFNRLHMPWVAVAFFLKAASYLSAFAEPQTFDTYLQPLWMLILHWTTNLLLAFTLVYVAVQQSKNRMAELLKNLPDALVAAKRDGTILFCNDAFARLCGAFDSNAMLGKPVPILLPEFGIAPMTPDQLRHVLQLTVQKAPTIIERELISSHGQRFPAEIMFSSFRDFGEPVLLAQIHDQSERKRAEEERLRHATIDRITGLPNRALLEELLTSVVSDNERQQQQCAVLMIDLDHFMRINDTMGHAAGDALIAQVAQVLNKVLDSNHVLGRFGGDEFLIVLPGLPDDAGAARAIAEATAKTVCKEVARTFSISGVDLRLGASVGICLMASNGNTAENLIQRAELAMYQAKEQGRGRWAFFDARMDEKLLQNIRMDAALRGAIERGELQLQYQPILDAGSGRVAKVEALIRWHSDEFGLVKPNAFIPILEQSALILEIGKWIVEEAVRQAAVWHRNSPTAPVVSINISSRQFLAPEFEAELMHLLQHHAVAPAHIELELTETVLVDNDAELTALLKRLGDAGISISLDDFGTGYSSLSYLARFDVKTVKIDQSFISDLEFDDRHRSLVKVIIAMGHSLNLKVVAEGVETEAQKAFLLEHRCDYLQGYLFGEPVGAAQIRF